MVGCVYSLFIGLRVRIGAGDWLEADMKVENASSPSGQAEEKATGKGKSRKGKKRGKEAKMREEERRREDR